MDDGSLIRRRGRPRKDEGHGPLPGLVRDGYDLWLTDAARRKAEKKEIRRSDIGPISFHRETVVWDTGLLACGHYVKPPVLTPFAWCDCCYRELLRMVIGF